MTSDTLDTIDHRKIMAVTEHFGLGVEILFEGEKSLKRISGCYYAYEVQEYCSGKGMSLIPVSGIDRSCVYVNPDFVDPKKSSLQNDRGPIVFRGGMACEINGGDFGALRKALEGDIPHRPETITQTPANGRRPSTG